LGADEGFLYFRDFWGTVSLILRGLGLGEERGMDEIIDEDEPAYTKLD